MDDGAIHRGGQHRRISYLERDDELSFEYIVLVPLGHPRNPKGSGTYVFGSQERGLG